MRVLSVEPTPNPNSMKLNLDASLPPGVSHRFAAAEAGDAPGFIQRILAVPGVISVYQVADFMAIERHPKAGWQAVLPAVLAAFEPDRVEPGDRPGAVPGGSGVPGDSEAHRAPDTIEVFVQMFRGLPMQVKLRTPAAEARFALPARFAAAARAAVAAAPDLFAERRWVQRGLRYGALDEIGAEVVEQISAAYDEERLARLLSRALAAQPGAESVADALPTAEVAAKLGDPDWKVRYAALDRLDLTSESLPVLVRALADPHSAVRRLAVVYLGATGEAAALPHLIGALRDPAVAVRRAAGDCLSDLGDTAAIPAMTAALADTSKLVRWRAARFLYEVGNESVLPALRSAAGDPEFEVQLQVRMAIERITGGAPATGPAWKQMTHTDGPAQTRTDRQPQRRDG